MFEMAGIKYTAAQMREANADDAEVLEWIDNAQPGDMYVSFGEPCVCVEYAA